MTSLEQLIFKCTNETDCNVKVAIVCESIVLEVAAQHTLLLSALCTAVVRSQSLLSNELD